MPVETIIIAGGGIAGWMTAAVLARKTRCQITVIDQGGDDISLGYHSLAEPTLPSTPEFLANIGFDENQILRATGGTFTLGRAVAGWTDGPPGFHGYGDIGARIGAIAFHQLVAGLRAQGKQVNLANYTLSALCAQTGRFTRPPDDMRSVLSTMAYGIHVDTARFAAALAADARANGVQRHEGEIDDVEIDPDRLIKSISTKCGERIAGDFFIDCTGADSRLIGQALGASFESWAAWLPCNNFESRVAPTDAAPAPYTHIEAHSSGWRRFVPLQAGEVETVASTGGTQISGRRDAFWIGNCVGIGGAGALIDPIASTSLHLLQSAITRLVGFFPHAAQSPIEATEFNRQSVQELERARDYAILHYTLNARLGDPFWDECRKVDTPAQLAHQIALFESCGRLALHDGEVFEESDWVALFDLLGVRPRRFDALVGGISLPAIEQHFAKLRDVMLKAVASMPTHAAYIKANIA